MLYPNIDQTGKALASSPFNVLTYNNNPLFNKTLMQSIPELAQSLNEKDKLMYRASLPPYSLSVIDENYQSPGILGGPSAIGTSLSLSPTPKQQERIAQRNMPITDINAINTTLFPSTNKTTTTQEQNTLESEIDKAVKRESAVQTGSLMFDAMNYLREMFRGTSEPFVAPVIDTFTPTPSVAERNLAAGKRELSGMTAAQRALMAEYGMVEAAPGLLADESKAYTQMADQVALQELQRQQADQVRADEMRAKQAAVNADIINKNIEKQAQENMVSGQIMGTLQDRIYNTLSDMGRNLYNRAKLKAFLNGKVDADTYLKALASEKGLLEENKQTKTD